MKKRWTGVLLALVIIALAPSIAGCGGPSPEELAAITSTPLERAGWQTATPEKENGGLNCRRFMVGP